MSRFQAPAQNSLKMTLPLSRSLPALLKQYWYTKRGERVRVRGHAPFYATLGLTLGLSVMNTNSVQTTISLLNVVTCVAFCGTGCMAHRNSYKVDGHRVDLRLLT